MSQHKAVIDGVYQWVPEGPATARLHGQSTFGIHGASRVGDMRPVIRLPAVRTDAARVNDEKQRVVKSDLRRMQMVEASRRYRDKNR